jgi:hypothetical protein
VRIILIWNLKKQLGKVDWIDPVWSIEKIDWLLKHRIWIFRLHSMLGIT